MDFVTQAFSYFSTPEVEPSPPPHIYINPIATYAAKLAGQKETSSSCTTKYLLDSLITGNMLGPKNTIKQVQYLITLIRTHLTLPDESAIVMLAFCLVVGNTHPLLNYYSYTDKKDVMTPVMESLYVVSGRYLSPPPITKRREQRRKQLVKAQEMRMRLRQQPNQSKLQVTEDPIDIDKLEDVENKVNVSDMFDLTLNHHDSMVLLMRSRPVYMDVGDPHPVRTNWSLFILWEYFDITLRARFIKKTKEKTSPPLTDEQMQAYLEDHRCEDFPHPRGTFSRASRVGIFSKSLIESWEWNVSSFVTYQREQGHPFVDGDTKRYGEYVAQYNYMHMLEKAYNLLQATDWNKIGGKESILGQAWYFGLQSMYERQRQLTRKRV